MTSPCAGYVERTDPISQNDPSSHQNAKFFDDLASRYERMTSGATLVVAKHLVSIAPNINPSSIVHDNAAGTGILTRELFASLASDKQPPTIHATDAAAAMTTYIQSTIDASAPESPWHSVSATTMPSESLTFADDTFSHSFTNFGILFFTNPDVAAKEIFRTLRPGGTALVTCWSDLGYWNAWRATEARIRPHQTPFEWPIRNDWEDPATLEKFMLDAGFGSVQMHQTKSCRREKDVRTLIENLSLSLVPAAKSWSEDERAKLIPVLMEEIEKDEDHFFVDRDQGQVGIRMLANVAVCLK